MTRAGLRDAAAPQAKAAKGQRRPYARRMPAATRRDQVLDAALQIIAQDGYGAVSIEAIARRLDVTRPVIYNVFDGLDGVLYALLDRQEQRALDQLAATLTVDVDPRDLAGTLQRTIRDFVTMVAGDPLTWRLIFLASAGTPAAVRARIDRDREIVRRRIRDVFDVILKGGAGPGIDAEVVSHAALAMGEYFGRLILEQPHAVDVERLASTVGGLLAAVRP